MASRTAVERSSDETAVSQRVITAVATTKETDPVDLDPLYEAIDPDALDALYEQDGFERAKPPERIEFAYCGCKVAVAWDGSITVSAAVLDES